MSKIKESVYGAKEDWVDAVSYASGADDSQKLKYANFNDEEFYKSRISTAINAHKLNLDTPWDSSLSYCGLGNNHPLSRITWYWVEGTTEVGQSNVLKVLYQEQKDVTNFALGTATSAIYGPTGDDVDCYRLTDNGSNNKFRFSRWNNGASFDGSLSNYSTFQPFTQMPLHRVVLCPYVVCSTTDNDAIHSFDLNTYLSGTRKATYPRVRQINVGIYVDYLTPYEDQGVVRPNYNDINIDWKAWEQENVGYEYRVHRQGLGDTNSIPILDTTAAFDGLIDETGPTPVELNNVYLPITAGHASGTSGITIAGHLFGARGIGTGDINRTRVFGVASGFGLNFTEVAHKSDIRPDVIGDGAFLYCDASQITNDAFRDAVRRMVACFGLFFVDSEADATLPLDHDKVMLGLLNNGIGNGDYSKGKYNRDHEQWEMSDAHDVDYDPKTPPPFIDTNDYFTPMTFNQPWVRTPNTLYVLNSIRAYMGSLSDLYKQLWTIIDDNYTGVWTVEQTGASDLKFHEAYSDFAVNNFLTMNPIDNIVSIKMFPYNTDSNPGSSTTTSIKLGHYNTTIAAKTAQPTAELEFGTVVIPPYFGNCWMDRYTEYTLYAPFCGTLKLDPNIYMGRTILLSYLIDQITGSCTAVVEVKSDDGVNLHEDSLTGVVAADIPITGLNQATIQSQIFNANQQLKSGLLQTAVGLGSSALQIGSAIANGNVVQGASAAINGMGNFALNDIKNRTNEYNLHHNEVAPRTVGSASPLSGLCMDYRARVLISVPTIDPDFDEAEYARTKGYACLISGTIGNDNHGYCVAQNPKLDISCTETEKEMIRSLLASGVYV